MQKPRVLVADLDKSFLQSLAQGASQLELMTCTSQKEAQLAIADHKHQFSAVCLNTNLCDPFALPLVRFVRVHRPSTPLYLLGDSPEGTLSPNELHPLHIQALLMKPITPESLFQKLIPGSFFNLAEALEVAKSEKTMAGETKEAADDTMHAIEAKSFLCGQKSFFDIYVKLSAGKFVMIVKAGDNFEPDRVASYVKKGVMEFYIRRDAQLYYLQYCDKMTEAILQNSQISTEAKTGFVMNLGNETYDYMKSAGISESSLVLAQGFVKQANILVGKTGLRKISEVHAFLSNLNLADHGASCAMVTSLMVKSMGFEDEKVTGLIALGAFLHDVGMASLPEAIQKKEEQEEMFLPQEREVYETHPKLGADILAKVPHMNPLVLQIALQHHERRTRKGFPNKLGSGAISNAAEMVGLADLFLRVMRREDKDPLETIRKQYYDDFSLKTIDAFLKAMKPGA